MDSQKGFTLKNNTFGKPSHCNAANVALNLMFQPPSCSVYEWLLLTTVTLRRRSSILATTDPVLWSSCTLQILSAAYTFGWNIQPQLPALPCMYNYRICCLLLITLPNNIWRGRRRWIPNEVWKRLIRIAMVKSRHTSVFLLSRSRGDGKTGSMVEIASFFFSLTVFGIDF